MKILSVKSILVVGAITLGMLVFWPVSQGESCSQTSDEKVIEFVKHDYLQRMTRWDNDAAILGTRVPNISWGKIERSIAGNEEVLLVPFDAEGPGGKKGYFGMYQCKQGYVEYSFK